MWHGVVVDGKSLEEKNQDLRELCNLTSLKNTKGVIVKKKKKNPWNTLICDAAINQIPRVFWTTLQCYEITTTVPQIIAIILVSQLFHQS